MDDVAVGEDIAVGRETEAGAGMGPRTVAVGSAAAGGFDIDDGRTDEFNGVDYSFGVGVEQLFFRHHKRASRQRRLVAAAGMQQFSIGVKGTRIEVERHL
jgi:hypothetical protein